MQECRAKGLLTLDELLEEHRGQTVVVACHGGVVDAVFRHLLGMPMTGGFEPFYLSIGFEERAVEHPWIREF